MSDQRPINLFFDTETTGVTSPLHPKSGNQPHLVQLAFILTDPESRTRAEVNMIIRPDGWEIPKEASDIHGITTEMALLFGVPLRTAVSCFCHHMKIAEQLVGHNLQFDVKAIECALWQIGSGNSSEAVRTKPRFCTMENTKDLIKLPATKKQLAAGFGPYKSPKLTEAFKFYTGEPLEGAHDAMVDVRGCMLVYDNILDGSPKAGAA